MTLVCVVLQAESPSHYTDTRKLFDYGFENFQAMSVAENDSEIARQTQQDFGLLNTNEPFVTLDKNAYIIMPKAAEFSDAAFTMEETGEDGTVARLTYTYADREVGNVGIVKTGAKVADSYFAQDSGELDGDEDVIRIRPRTIVVTVCAVFLLVMLLYLGYKFYDNFYMMKHRRLMRRIDRERFREKKTKKRYRKRDRMFK
jgi:hypothetical protein